MKITITVDDQDFGTVCACALRYAMGRQTYMPSLVRDFVRPLLPQLPGGVILVMLNDCDFQARYVVYGDETIDKPGWIKWREELCEEIRRRENKNAGK